MAERNPDGTIKKGVVLNPKGRPKGSKHKLCEAFVSDTYDLWSKDGPEILVAAAADKPMEFSRMVASLVPKELVLNEGESAIDRLFERIPAENIPEFIEGVGLLAAAQRAECGMEDEGVAEEPTNLH